MSIRETDSFDQKVVMLTKPLALDKFRKFREADVETVDFE